MGLIPFMELSRVEQGGEGGGLCNWIRSPPSAKHLAHLPRTLWKGRTNHWESALPRERRMVALYRRESRGALLCLFVCNTPTVPILVCKMCLRGVWFQEIVHTQTALNEMSGCRPSDPFNLFIGWPCNNFMRMWVCVCVWCRATAVLQMPSTLQKRDKNDRRKGRKKKKKSIDEAPCVCLYIWWQPGLFPWKRTQFKKSEISHCTKLRKKKNPNPSKLIKLLSALNEINFSTVLYLLNVSIVCGFWTK